MIAGLPLWRVLVMVLILFALAVLAEVIGFWAAHRIWLRQFGLPEPRIHTLGHYDAGDRRVTG